MDFTRMAGEGYQAWLRDGPEMIAFDTETTGVEWFDRPFCVTAAWRAGMSAPTPGAIEAHYFEIDPDGPIWQPMLQYTPTLIGHNIKFDLQKVLMEGILSRESVYSERIHDTQLLAHLLDEHRPKSLKQLAQSVLGLATDEDEAVKAAKKVVKKELGLKSESEIGYHMLPREVVVPYAIKDAEFTLQLYEKLMPQLRWPDLRGLYDQERELLLVLLDMESRGFAVDLPYAEKTVKQYGGKIIAAENRIEDIVQRPVGKKKDEFNPNSPKQLTEWFAEKDIMLSSTDKAHLKAVQHPLAAALLELRSVTKTHGTYLLPILREVRDEDGRSIIHPNFRQNVRTGRMASGGAEA